METPPGTAPAAAPASPAAPPGGVTLAFLRDRMAAFVAEREWDRFHTPRNILLALTGEVGELAELFMWRGEVPPGCPGWTEAERTQLGAELADVLLYTVRLADVAGVDLGAATLRKMEVNARKYPADRARGRADKYTAYVDTEQLAAIERSVDGGAAGAGGGAAGGVGGATAPSGAAASAASAPPPPPAAMPG